MKNRLRQVAEQAYEIYTSNQGTFSYDGRAADKRIKELAKEHGFTTEQVWDEMRLIYAEMTLENNK